MERLVRIVAEIREGRPQSHRGRGLFAGVDSRPRGENRDRLRARRVGDAELRRRAERSADRLAHPVHSQPQIGRPLLPSLHLIFLVLPGSDWRRIRPLPYLLAEVTMPFDAEAVARLSPEA